MTLPGGSAPKLQHVDHSGRASQRSAAVVQGAFYCSWVIFGRQRPEAVTDANMLPVLGLFAGVLIVSVSPPAVAA